MDPNSILISYDNLVRFFDEESYLRVDYFDKDYSDGVYFSISDKKLMVVYEAESEDDINSIKNHFLVEGGLTYCTIFTHRRVIFYRNFGDTKYFIFSEHISSKSKKSKIDKLVNMKYNFDIIFQYKDISGEFYQSFKKKRNIIVQNISNDYPTLRKYLISQKLFDRIFFIYFLCHKGLVRINNEERITGRVLFSNILLNDDFLSNLYDLFNVLNSQENRSIVIGKFKVFAPYLNGGLFRIDEHEINLNLSMTKNDWSDIFTFLNSYHWIIEDIKTFDLDEDKVLTPEILGHIYERSVIEWESIDFDNVDDEKIAAISERKLKGVYYTPENITEYISHNSIEDYIKNQMNITIDLNDFMNGSREDSLFKILDLLEKVYILDPACGSGAFLIKAAEILFYYKRRINYLLNNDVNTYEIKMDIITNNLYGVDILSGAGEIAKLRLWLWVISEMDYNDDIMPLPNIEYNIKTGDSIHGWHNEKITQSRWDKPLTERVDGIFMGLLVNSNSEEIEIMKKSKELLNTWNMNNYIESYNNILKLYKKTHGIKATLMRAVIEEIKNSIYNNINQAYVDYINNRYVSKKNKLMKSDITPFHWIIDFNEIIRSGGFDIILGNPPYFNLKGNDLLKNTKYYFDLKNGVLNSAAIFMSRSADLLKKGGQLGMIIPKSFMYVESWIKILELTLNNFELSSVVDVSKGFKDVLLEQIIVLGRKIHETDMSNQVKLIGKFGKDQTENIVIQKQIIDDGVFIFNDSYQKIWKRMNENTTLLGDISENYRGIGAQKHSNEKEGPSTVEIIGGKHIIPFGVRNEVRFVSLNNLNTYSGKVSRLKNKRIIVQNIVAHIRDHIKLIASIDDGYNLDTVNNININNKDYSLYYVLGLLNSKLIHFYVYNFIYFNAIRTMHFDSRYSGKIPIANISENEMNEIEGIVVKLMEIPHKVDQKEVNLYAQLEHELNSKIYRIYQLDENMIKLVEEQYGT
jgi:hypothetical protein